MKKNIINKYNEWLNNEYIDPTDREILNNMSEKEIEESFSKDLSFGTSGIRGIMGLGSGKINKYTIGKVSVGLSNYLNKHFDNPSVVIAYDTRNNSKEYAYDTALILNYYGIKTYIFNEVASTPELSFSVKYLNCSSGIIITSSHNSKIYNGYKIYNRYGGQIVPPEDELVIKEINDIINLKLLKKAPLNNELFNYVSDDVHNAFINENKKVIINKYLINKHSKDIKITYSSLHGVGLKTSIELLNDLGFTNHNITEEQSTYDGNFPNATEPNPEYIINYDLPIKYAKENNSDVILMTDPDADRLGVMYRDDNNEYKLINGNLLGVLFAYYISNNIEIKENSYMIRSIVSDSLIDKIAESKNIKMYEVLTGCKNIANKKISLSNMNYLFGYEESLGYVFNNDINDKNGFSAMLCMLEILCYLKENNISLDEYINNIYKEFNYVLNETLSFEFNEINYTDIILDIMNNFRNDKICFEDKNYTKFDYLNGVGDNRTNALKYVFSDSSWIMIRPSGTEPKIKIYIGTCGKDMNECKNKLNKFEIEIHKILKMN